MTSNNPFEEMFKKYSESLSEYNNFDWDSWAKAIQANNEAAAEYGKSVADSIQNIVKRQSENAQRYAEETINLFKDFVTAESPESAFSKQASYVKSCCESAISESKKISDISADANKKALALIDRNLKEVWQNFNNISKSAAANTNSRKKSAA